MNRKRVARNVVCLTAGSSYRVTKESQNFRVTNATSMDKLRVAIAAERADIAGRLYRYQRLLQTITEYQRGIGKAPAGGDFLQWREDARTGRALQELQSKDQGD
jgi:uncharacterized protein YjiS (DUF1127 family)